MVKLTDAIEAHKLLQEYSKAKPRITILVVPEQFSRRIVIAKYLAERLCREEGAILSVTEIGVWPSVEIPGWYQRLRRSEGLEESLADHSTEVIAPEDMDYLKAAICACSLQSWDFFLISKTEQVFIFQSHDEVLEIVTPYKKLRASISGDLESIGMRAV
jgi:hypothetical protein